MDQWLAGHVVGQWLFRWIELGVIAAPAWQMEKAAPDAIHQQFVINGEFNSFLQFHLFALQ